MKRKGLLSQPSPPEDLSLPTYRVSNFANPEGIPQQSPGLRGTSNPGFVALGEPTPTGLCPWVPERSHNPVGVERQFAHEPRVASCSVWTCSRTMNSKRVSPWKSTRVFSSSWKVSQARNPGLEG